MKRAEAETKNSNLTMTKGQADFVVGLIALAWGSSYLLMKIGLDGIPVFSLIAERFLIAFIALVLIFLPRMKHTTMKTLGLSSFLGLFLFGIFAFLMKGMEQTTASNASFLVGTTVVIVPVLNACIARKMPGRGIRWGVLVTLAGIALLSLQSSLTLGRGDLLCLAAAGVRAVHILLTDKLAGKEDAMLLGIWQVGFAGLYGLAATLIFETPVMPSGTAQWVAAIGLALVCSAFGYVAQPVAQKFTTPEHTALILSLEPVFSAIFAFIFLQERLNLQGYIGAALVLFGVLLASDVKLGFSPAASYASTETAPSARKVEIASLSSYAREASGFVHQQK